MAGTYFVKSLEQDFHTKTLVGSKKVDFQSIDDIVKTRTIKLNTKSFGRKKRLSTTILSDNYLKTYRPQGIIFQTLQKPDYVLPFDLALLSKAQKIVVHYYRIKDNLHAYYDQALIDGFERFIFKDFDCMVERFPDPKKVWLEVNRFRERAGFKSLPKEKYRLVEYNEAVFHRPVNIVPVAIFGYTKYSGVVAKKLGLPHYASAKEFWKYARRKK
jgi:hypothetical protein